MTGQLRRLELGVYIPYDLGSRQRRRSLSVIAQPIVAVPGGSSRKRQFLSEVSVAGGGSSLIVGSSEGICSSGQLQSSRCGR